MVENAEPLLKRSNYHTNIWSLLIAAKVSVEVKNTQKEARRLALVAKNARAVATRAGNQALGFKVITDFVDEFAAKTIQLAVDIHTHSLVFSRCAWSLAAVDDLTHRLEQTQAKIEDRQNDELDKCLAAQRRIHREHQVQFNKLLYQLGQLLDSVYQQMRSASFIAASSKVEASAAGEYQGDLDVVARDIADSAEMIKISIKHCLKLIAQKG